MADYVVGVFPTPSGEPVARVSMRVHSGTRVFRDWARFGPFVPVVAYRADPVEVTRALARLGCGDVRGVCPLDQAALWFGWMPISPELHRATMRQLKKSADSGLTRRLYGAWERQRMYWYGADGSARSRVQGLVFAGASR